MIKNLNIKKYRKLEDIEFDFTKYINIISGTNGTCKTSLLHIISNSFQAINTKSPWLKEKDVVGVIKKINKISNPKIEYLTRGDKEYNDPAPEIKGELFKSSYFDGSELNFRRHNSASSIKTRFSIKPKYNNPGEESLIPLPIIYLGLFRLFSYGEFKEDDLIQKITAKMPDKYLDEIKDIYEKFTGVQIEYENQHDMGGIKTRAQFKSNKKGIDSNTISAGEDNLFIILTAIVSLKYYYESIESQKEIESIILIDELDATLHPAFQIKLLDLFREYSKEYKIQIFFTTHSITLLEYAFSRKDNVIYLLDNIDTVSKIDNIDKYKVQMFLKNKLEADIYEEKKIPIFTEDEEARIFLNLLFSYYKESNEEFSKVLSYFHLVDASLSSTAITNIFKDDSILKTTLRSIAILDGDQPNINITNHLIKLPGNKSPEILLFEYANKIYDENNKFWTNLSIIEKGYTKPYFREYIKVCIDSIEAEITEKKAQGIPTSGIRREKSKKCFNQYQDFFKCLTMHWIRDETNKVSIERFFANLKIVFKKVADYHNINPNIWNN